MKLIERIAKFRAREAAEQGKAKAASPKKRWLDAWSGLSAHGVRRMQALEAHEPAQEPA